jgi:hypothetical protein
MHRDGITDSLLEASMNSRKLTVLTIIAGVLALGEFGSALMIWLEDTGPAAGALLAVLFGLFFLLGAWLLRSRRVTAGTIFVGLLCLVEVAGVPTYTRHNAGDRVFQMRTRVPLARPPHTIQLCIHCRDRPAGFWVSCTGGQTVRRPWCLSCCEGLDRDRCDMIPFHS